MICFFFFKQKTAYEMRMSDWSSDVCSSDLVELLVRNERPHVVALVEARTDLDLLRAIRNRSEYLVERRLVYIETGASRADLTLIVENACSRTRARRVKISVGQHRSEEHTSELQSLMRNSYAVLCLKTKTQTPHITQSAQ